MELALLTDIDPLLAELIPHADEVFIASGYVGHGAVDTLLRRLQSAKRAPKLEVLLGLGLDTSPEALAALLKAAETPGNSARIHLVRHRPGVLFHPKVYFQAVGSAIHLVIGSGNFTGAGQFRNHELYLHLEATAASPQAQQFADVRGHWMDKAFSQPLTPAIVNGLLERGELSQRLKAAEGILADLRGSLDECTAKVLDLFPSGPRTPVPVPPVRPTIQDRVRGALDEGCICSFELSLAPLFVPVTPDLYPEGDADKPNPGKIVRQVMTARAQVMLLPESVMAEFEKLRYEAERDLAQISVPLPEGRFVPRAYHLRLRALIRRLRAEHEKLLRQHVRRMTPRQTHFKTRLDAEIAETWAGKHPNNPKVPREVREQVWRRVSEHIEGLRTAPNEAVPLTISTLPHPVALKWLLPNHPAWKVTGAEAGRDEALLQSTLRLLEWQARTVERVAGNLREPDRLSEELRRVRPLICVPTQATTKALRLISRWTGPAARACSDSAKDAKAARAAVSDATKKIRALMQEHGSWIRSLQRVPVDVAFLHLQEQCVL